MSNSFFNMDDSIDSDASFLNLSGAPRRSGSDFSFYEDSSLFSGDQSQSPLFSTPMPAASQTSAKRKKPDEKMTPTEAPFPSSCSSPSEHDQSQLFMSPGPAATPAKKKKVEEKMTPAENSFSSISGDQSPPPLFMTPGSAVTQTPAKKMNDSFSTAPTPKMRSPAPAGISKPEKKIIPNMESGHKKTPQVEPVREAEKQQQQMFTDIPTPAPAPATPPAPERKEVPLNMNQKEAQAKEFPPKMSEMIEAQTKEMPPTMKQMMEAQMKEILVSVEALESHQEKGSAQLLAKAAAIKEDVAAYKRKLTKVKQDYVDRLHLALKVFGPID